MEKNCGMLGIYIYNLLIIYIDASYSEIIYLYFNLHTNHQCANIALN